MGCKQSQLRGDPASGVDTASETNSAIAEDLKNRPAVPPASWYGQPLQEVSSLPMTAFHHSRRGAVVFAPTFVPAAREELDSRPGGQPDTLDHGTVVDLGQDHLYAMAYLYNTGLYTEHRWRLRVPHGNRHRFERPFYDTLMTVKLIVNGCLVPDALPHRDSVNGCTATINAPEALARWKHVPLVLVPDTEHFTFSDMRLFDGMVASFAKYCSELHEGEYQLDVEVGYGCHSENDFQSGFIATGSVAFMLDRQARARLETLSTMALQRSKPRYVPNARIIANSVCATCNLPLKLKCTVCGAAVCGMSSCIFADRKGYPMACESHPTPEMAAAALHGSTSSR